MRYFSPEFTVAFASLRLISLQFIIYPPSLFFGFILLEQSDWRSIQKSNFTNWERLALFLELSEKQKEKILQNPRFVLNLPIRLANKIEKGTLDDPILKQFLPVLEEGRQTEGFTQDPTEDKAFRKAGKLLHKYEGRVLIVTTSACVMHCRFCFRQNFPYETERKNFEEELQVIGQDSSIKEVILSGGDPLSLSNSIIKGLFERLAAFDHIKRIRFHTRFPIGIPERIDNEFIAILENSLKQVYFVLHCNHPQELDEEILARLRLLKKAGAVLLNQTVLLKGINDCPKVLQALSEKLVDHGILPYYLHQLDQVQGTAHFEVEEKEGVSIIEQLTSKMSGYAVPKYVKEIPQKESKTSLIGLHSLNRVNT